MRRTVWIIVALVILVALGLSACAPRYNCQTVFGLKDPPRNAKGETYWVSECDPIEYVPVKGLYPGAVKK